MPRRAHRASGAEPDGFTLQGTAWNTEGQLGTCDGSDAVHKEANVQFSPPLSGKIRTSAVAASRRLRDASIFSKAGTKALKNQFITAMPNRKQWQLLNSRCILE
jgi:hypothetical protein